MILCREAWIVLGFMEGWLAINIHFEGKLISVTRFILFVLILDMGLKNISQYFLVFIAITTSMMIIQGTLCIHQEKKNRVSLDKCIIFPIFTQNRVL